MDLMFRINNSLPDSNRVMAITHAIQLLNNIFEGKIKLHGSWFLDLAFNDSDLDVAVITSYKKIYKVRSLLIKKLHDDTSISDEDTHSENGYAHLRMRNTVFNAAVRVINLSYSSIPQAPEIVCRTRRKGNHHIIESFSRSEEHNV